jgi:hypothetical protein
MPHAIRTPTSPNPKNQCADSSLGPTARAARNSLYLAIPFSCSRRPFRKVQCVMFIMPPTCLRSQLARDDSKDGGIALRRGCRQSNSSRDADMPDNPTVRFVRCDRPFCADGLRALHKLNAWLHAILHDIFDWPFAAAAPSVPDGRCRADQGGAGEGVETCRRGCSVHTCLRAARGGTGRSHEGRNASQ